MTYSLTALLHTAKGQSPDAACAALRALEEVTRQEPGCLRFEVMQCREEPAAFILWEIFTSKEALDEHLAAPHTKAYFERRLTDIVQIWVHDPVEALCDAA